MGHTFNYQQKADCAQASKVIIKIKNSTVFFFCFIKCKFRLVMSDTFDLNITILVWTELQITITQNKFSKGYRNTNLILLNVNM